MTVEEEMVKCLEEAASTAETSAKAAINKQGADSNI